MAVFGFILLLPLIALFFLADEAEPISADLFSLAQRNTLLLGMGVVLSSSLLGVAFALFHTFYEYPYKRILHGLLLMPLAFPAYVLAFIYLGAFGPATEWSAFFEIQGAVWFLVFVLSLALTPYVYYFSSLGLQSMTQSERETESLLQGGRWLFFRYSTWPRLLPFLISAQILVMFETLSDFGAASIVNVPVMTTMIYKMWFDLFSFAGAVQISLKYSGVILLFLVIEFLFKTFSREPVSSGRDPLRPQSSLPFSMKALLCLLFFYILLAFVYPCLQILFWVVQLQSFQLWVKAAALAIKTMALGAVVGILVVGFSVTLLVWLRQTRQNPRLWVVFSTVGYSLPGSILAVAVYAVLLALVSNVTETVLLVGLVLALSHKFLTAAMRPLSDAVQFLPKELFEISDVFQVPWWRRIRLFLFPYLRSSCGVATLLVMIEVMKEMPLTLMLAPGGFQTLSIQIFNFTSEGEWEKASLPGLMLVLIGMTSVALINLKDAEAGYDS